MATLLVRNLEDKLKAKLQLRAERHGRSMEEEVREILRHAADEENFRFGGLGTDIAALFKKTGLTKDVPELRGHKIKATEDTQ